MSSRIRMVGGLTLLLKVVVLLFSTALVRSDQITGSLKSVKLNENITYDCIDIYKQPSLNHPLLKTHKIQMKPSVSISRFDLKNQTRNNERNQKQIGCPDGTVPILRNTKDYVSNVNPLTADSPGTHVSGVRAMIRENPYHGVQAWFSVFELNIAKDQASYASIYLGTGNNFIQAGWMINPSAFGDQHVWTYGYWRGKDGKGCYNVKCPGFIQVSKDDPIDYPNTPTNDVGWYGIFIHQDQHTGNWWISKLIKNQPNVDMGYWPKELFDLISEGAQMAGAGGFVQASPSGSSPPMGSGQRPSVDLKQSAMFTNVEVLNSHYIQRTMKDIPHDLLIDSPKCYGLWTSPLDSDQTARGYYFNYGGPGGNSCGV